jgi:signal transduction histidine kinase
MDDIQSDNYLKASTKLVPPKSDDSEHFISLMEELRREERQLSVSVIASMIAHFVGTPLNVIVGRAGLIRRHPDATEPIINDAACIQQKVEQVAEKLRSLIDLLTPTVSAAQCEPDTLVQEAVELYRPIARMRGIELRVNPSQRGLPRVKRHPTFALLTSLLSLGIHEMAAGNVLEVKTSLADASGGPAVQFVLSIPGCVFDDPRRFARFENQPHDSADRLQVLGICASVARNAGGQLQTLPRSKVGCDLVLQWPSGTQFNL